MTRFGLRSTVLSLSLLAMLAVPAVADAQRRVAVPRSQSNVIVGARSYSPHYFYRPYYYGPSYRSFYPYYPFSFSFGYGWGYPYYGVGIGYGYGYGYPGYGYGYPFYGPYYPLLFGNPGPAPSAPPPQNLPPQFRKRE